MLKGVVREQLADGHGRPIGDVRISVTDRCNFRCQYCMPAEGLPWLDRESVLTFEELERITRVLSEMGVSSVRLTGGEPLVRRDLPRLVGMLASLPGVEDLALTTNGYLLERDAEALVKAGVDRFNVSIDSLERDRFYRLTRRDALPRVLAGLDALARFPEAHPIKVNAVALRGVTEAEILPFARFAREHDFEVRFIEFMPLDADRNWSEDQVLTGEEIRSVVERTFPMIEEEREPSATARVFRFADGAGRIGFINPVSRAVLLRLQPHQDHGRRPSAHLPLLARRDRPARPDAQRGRRPRAGTDHPRGSLAQGAQAQGRRAGLPPAAADDVGDRRLSYFGAAIAESIARLISWMPKAPSSLAAILPSAPTVKSHGSLNPPSGATSPNCFIDGAGVGYFGE